MVCSASTVTKSIEALKCAAEYFVGSYDRNIMANFPIWGIKVVLSDFSVIFIIQMACICTSTKPMSTIIGQ